MIVVMMAVIVAVAMPVFVRMLFLAAIFRVTFGKVVMMEMEKTLQEKHRQKTAQHPAHGPVQRLQMLVGIGQEMEQGDAEHEPGDKADGDLQAGMRQSDKKGQPTARQRCEQHKQTINRQQPTGRNHVPEICNSTPGVEFRVWRERVRLSARAARNGSELHGFREKIS
jgi:hypothetical protein